MPVANAENCPLKSAMAMIMTATTPWMKKSNAPTIKSARAIKDVYPHRAKTMSRDRVALMLVYVSRAYKSVGTENGVPARIRCLRSMKSVMVKIMTAMARRTKGLCARMASFVPGLQDV